MRRTLAILLVLVPVLRADASVVSVLTVDELLARSSVVCLARVEETRARWRGDRVVTDVAGECERAVKGATDGDALSWTFEGGVVDGVGMRVPGEPGFRAGDRAIVFLSEAAGDLRVTGMAQGALFVSGPAGAEVVGLRAGGAMFVRPDASRGYVRAAPWIVSPRPLAEVLTDLETRATR